MRNSSISISFQTYLSAILSLYVCMLVSIVHAVCPFRGVFVFVVPTSVQAQRDGNSAMLIGRTKPTRWHIATGGVRRRCEEMAHSRGGLNSSMIQRVTFLVLLCSFNGVFRIVANGRAHVSVSELRVRSSYKRTA